MTVDQFAAAVHRFLLKMTTAAKLRDVEVTAPGFPFPAMCETFHVSQGGGNLGAERKQIWFDPAYLSLEISDQPLVICIRVVDMPGDPLEGSRQDRCCHCDAPVWVSPASRHMVKENRCYIFCLECATDSSRSSSSVLGFRMD